MESPLDRIPKKKPEELFKVPEGYFDGLSEKLADQAIPKEGGRIITLWSAVKVITSIAAVFVICAGIAKYTRDEVPYVANEITVDEILDSGELTESDLVAYAAETLEEENEEVVSEYEEYLIEEGSDLDTYINEL